MKSESLLIAARFPETLYRKVPRFEMELPKGKENESTLDAIKAYLKNEEGPGILISGMRGSGKTFFLFNLAWFIADLKKEVNFKTSPMLYLSPHQLASICSDRFGTDKVKKLIGYRYLFLDDIEKALVLMDERGRMVLEVMFDQRKLKGNLTIGASGKPLEYLEPEGIREWIRAEFITFEIIGAFR